MRFQSIWFVFLVLLVGIVFRPVHAQSEQKNLGEPLAKAKLLVEQHLAELNAQNAQVIAIDDSSLRNLIANTLFVVVRFPQWPVLIAPPKPLALNNIYAVRQEKLTHLASPEALQAFFQENLVLERQQPANYEHAVQGWLRLSQEFSQDGFFKFELSGKYTRSNEGQGGHISAKLNVVPRSGDKGFIDATLYFQGARLIKIEEVRKVFAGIRPRCQATLLLHPNPIIREIAERDLLVMGLEARQYLMEQRTKANPALRQAIDRVWQQIIEQDR